MIEALFASVPITQRSISSLSGLKHGPYWFAISPILNFLHIDSSFASGLLTGILEITNGIQSISSIACKKISINLIITAFLLGFGGISVFLQVFSITAKTDLSIKPYIYGKILHGIFAAFYTFVFIQVFPFFNLDL